MKAGGLRAAGQDKTNNELDYHRNGREIWRDQEYVWN